MDIVINFNNFKKYRIRDLETLKYQLRSIEKNLAGIGDLFIITDKRETLPDFINERTCKIVYHKDIIDEKYLPCFNKNLVELNIHNIDKLSKKFLYIPEYTFIMNPCKESDFFKGQKPKLKIKEIENIDKYLSSYFSSSVAFDACCIDANYTPVYNDFPIKASIKEGNFATINKLDALLLKDSCSRFEDASNLNWNLFDSYQYFTNEYETSELSYTISESWPDKEFQIVMINNSDLITLLEFKAMKQAIIEKLSKRFPNKSKYEK